MSVTKKWSSVNRPLPKTPSCTVSWTSAAGSRRHRCRPRFSTARAMACTALVGGWPRRRGSVLQVVGLAVCGHELLVGRAGELIGVPPRGPCPRSRVVRLGVVVLDQTDPGESAFVQEPGLVGLGDQGDGVPADHGGQDPVRRSAGELADDGLPVRGAERASTPRRPSSPPLPDDPRGHRVVSVGEDVVVAHQTRRSARTPRSCAGRPPRPSWLGRAERRQKCRTADPDGRP